MRPASLTIPVASEHQKVRHPAASNISSSVLSFQSALGLSSVSSESSLDSVFLHEGN